MRPLHDYLAQLQITRATKAHTAETSFYPTLKTLFDTVGARLRPQVHCVMNLRNAGSGLPDGGFFSADQLNVSEVQSGAGEKKVLQSKPSRGAIEVKPLSTSMQALSNSAQVTRYGAAYRHVLITNLREFWLVERVDGRSKVRERFSLAQSEHELFQLATKSEELAAKEVALLEFLERVLRTPAPLAAPEDVAWFLASYARDALQAVENAPVGTMEDISEALSNALGVAFRDAKGQHFFHSTLVQTLFYGVFSAWVLWGQQPREKEELFRWRDTTELLQLPILKVLFHEMTRPTLLFTKALSDRLDLAEATLNRVDRVEFYKRFPQHEAVQYFYEPFLEAFDAELRRQLGVWYTPSDVVTYMVERVDRTLRDELGIEDGLADPSVLLLDPACGTGAFLLATLERIAKTLEEQDGGATVAARLVEVVTKRLYGFEILPAPFVIAHLQISLYLQRKKVSLPEGQRVGVYLTNALTGWGRPTGRQPKLPAEFAAERTAANNVKQKTPVLVVLGNPPYNAFAGVQPEEEQESVDVYKEGLVTEWKVRKFNLDDLFVRFFRLAERKIADQSGRGVVCFISNASYAADASFAVMRERFLKEFDTITIDNLNGDSRETGKLTPEGKPDPSIFSTDRNREGIRVGTAIGTFVLRGAKPSKGQKRLAQVRWREFWGAAKRHDLLTSLTLPDAYVDVKVARQDRWSFRPRHAANAYKTWVSAVTLCEHEPISGLAEMRKGGLIANDRQALAERMQAYFDDSRSWTSVKKLLGGLSDDAGRYPASETRTKLLGAGEVFEEANIRRYALLPLDVRFCYHTVSRPLWNEPRPTLAPLAVSGNRLLVVRRHSRRPDEGIPATITSALPDYHMLDPNVVAIPLRWRAGSGKNAKFTANLSVLAKGYLASLGVKNLDDEPAATLVWFHYLAIVHSPRYLDENGDAVRADVPRVPLPEERDVLERSAALGRRIADLLDPDQKVVGVTSGTIDAQLQPLGKLRKQDGTSIDPASRDLSITKRWGTLQRGSIVMPGRGHLTTCDLGDAHPLGPSGWNVWLNDSVCWERVPEKVWNLMVGGYPVIKKWLSYRENTVLGRDLTLDEAVYVTSMVRRIAALLLMSEELDAVYLAASARSWQAAETAPASAPTKTATRSDDKPKRTKSPKK